jgi:hypothetical protein
VTCVIWNLISVHLETVLLSVQDRFAPNVPEAHKSFWTHPMVLVGDEAQVEDRFGPNLGQDRCTVCAEHTIGLKIVLDAPDGTPR